MRANSRILQHGSYKLLLAFLCTGAVLFTFAQPVRAADNLFAKNYKEQNTYQLKSANPNPDTQIMLGKKKEEDNIRMLEEGYDMIGSSGFTSQEASPEEAREHGKTIKADRVLIYKKAESAKTSSSKLQLVKEAAKKGAEIDPNDLVEEPTQYAYYASYWAKLPMPSFGVHIIKLKLNTSGSPVEGEENIEELPGLRVIAVINDSPASKSGIQRGDTLLKLADVELSKPDDLFAAVKKYAGQTIDVVLQRNQQTQQVKVTLNSRK